jgi:hypothetical protein
MKYSELALILLTIVLCFLIGMWIAQKLEKKKKPREVSDSQLRLSAFSAFDPMVFGKNSKKIDPLREAEVYMTYGKKAEANNLLESAYRRGEISSAEMAAFWEKYGS